MSDVITRIKHEKKASRRTLYINDEVFNRFKHACKSAKIPVSMAVEELMKDALKKK